MKTQLDFAKMPRDRKDSLDLEIVPLLEILVKLSQDLAHECLL